MDILSNPRNAIMVAHFTMACAASRAHAALATVCYAEYGEQGPLISGCERQHWPERYKDALRDLARTCSDHNNAARDARPPRMHNSTVTHIARLVATRDGVGRYGYAPY